MTHALAAAVRSTRSVTGRRGVIMNFRHGSNALDTFMLVLRKHCQAGLAGRTPLPGEVGVN
jgi:hypothetical protein